MELRNQDFSVFGQGSNLTGDFVLIGPTRIASRLDGTILMQNLSHLILEREGDIKGTLECHNVDIYGLFTGDIKSTGRVTIYPSAKVDGSVKCNDLVVHAGAQLNMTSEAEKDSGLN